MMEIEACYDCGSTIPGHHTKECELAPANAIHDLPSIPGTQHWTETRKNGKRVPVCDRPRTL